MAESFERPWGEKTKTKTKEFREAPRGKSPKYIEFAPPLGDILALRAGLQGRDFDVLTACSPYGLYGAVWS